MYVVVITFTIFIFTDFIYPYGIDWESFIHISIQHWDNFYMWWIREGKNIFVIYPNSFFDGMAKDTLKKLAHYTNFEWNETRLNCILMDWES